MKEGYVISPNSFGSWFFSKILDWLLCILLGASRISFSFNDIVYLMCWRNKEQMSNPLERLLTYIFNIYVLLLCVTKIGCGIGDLQCQYLSIELMKFYSLVLPLRRNFLEIVFVSSIFKFVPLSMKFINSHPTAIYTRNTIDDHNKCAIYGNYQPVPMKDVLL